MGRIGYDEQDKYSSSSSAEWFRLPNDKDVATVQFLTDNADEFEIYATHVVKIDGRDRYVDCLRNHDESVDVCPFCAAGVPTKVVRFLVMFDTVDQKVKIWERGKRFIDRIANYTNKYQPLSNYVFEIERNGKAGSMDTTYEVFPTDEEAFDTADMDYPKILGGIIMDKSFEDMEYYLDNDKFPDTEAKASNEGVQRRHARRQTEEEPVSRQSTRAQAGTSRRSSRRTVKDETDVF